LISQLDCGLITLIAVERDFWCVTIRREQGRRKTDNNSHDVLGELLVEAICEACPIRQECLEAVLADPDLVGLWGGTTDAERRELRRRVAYLVGRGGNEDMLLMSTISPCRPACHRPSSRMLTLRSTPK